MPSKLTAKAIDTIADRKIRVEFRKLYEENSSSFLKEITNRKFVQHKEISPLIAMLLSEISAKNPQANFKDISVLLALDESNNAYNTGENIVVLNLPLVLNISNEMQLSYILCHEIAHQHLNHVFTAVKERLIKNASQAVVFP